MVQAVKMLPRSTWDYVPLLPLGGSTWRFLGDCEGREVAPAVDSGLRPSSPFGGGAHGAL